MHACVINGHLILQTKEKGADTKFMIVLDGHQLCMQQDTMNPSV